MQTTDFPSGSPFDPVTGALLPAFRDAYVQGHLPPPPAADVEAYLKASTIQTKMALGRYRELAAAAQAEGRTFEAPLWVQQRLRFQPTASVVGPLRRPAVRVALVSFLALGGASVVQWIRNEPLVPAPVVAAVSRAATSASQATQRLVQQFTAPSAPAPAPEPSPAPVPKPVVRVLTARVPAPRAAAVTPAIESRPATIAALPTDSLARTLPTKLPVAGSATRSAATAGSIAPKATTAAAAPVSAAPAPAAPAPAVPVAAGLVRGRILDAQNRPLAGATVMVKGTRLVASTDAAGNYELNVPANAVLNFGYGGYFDQIVRNPGSGTLNVTLQQDVAARGR